jgi:hypothetical protein
MSHADPWGGLAEWVRRECEALRRAIVQQFRRLREQQTRERNLTE